MNFENSKKFADNCDSRDELSKFRNEFHIPKHEDGKNSVYLCGNSLGLQPKKANSAVMQEMQQWQDYGVLAHHEGELPWMHYHEFLAKNSAELVGASCSEVVVMNSLTVNLHLLMVSFYRPTKHKRKILIEANAFPSDHFAVESQIRFHGFDPKEDLILLEPKEGDEGDISYSTDECLEIIEKQGDEIALVLLPGVHYLNGQVIDLESITKASHNKDCVVGADLAHAAGNIPLELSEWGIDFAVWCNYKYLNSGPGAIGACFIHKNHIKNDLLPRFEGWWGQDKKIRFLMENNFQSTNTADSWQLSNPPIFSMAPIRVSLDMFSKAGGIKKLREKSIKLTGFLSYLLDENLSKVLRVITPKGLNKRGAQLSIVLNDTDPGRGREVFNKLCARGVVLDWREPNVIRVAPVPLYNSFLDVYQFAQILSESI